MKAVEVGRFRSRLVPFVTTVVLLWSLGFVHALNNADAEPPPDWQVTVTLLTQGGPEATARYVPDDGTTWNNMSFRDGFTVAAERGGEPDVAVSSNTNIAGVGADGVGTHFDVSLVLGDLSCRSPNGARVEDIARTDDGAITRLDAVFMTNCGDSLQNGFTVGEVTINEAGRELQAAPSRLLLPPTSSQSSTHLFPVRFQNTTGAPVSVRSLNLVGPDRRDFSVVRQTCTTGALTSQSSCTATVEFAPSGRRSLATLAVSDSAGHTITSVPIDGGLLPGTTSWRHNGPQRKSVSAYPEHLAWQTPGRTTFGQSIITSDVYGIYRTSGPVYAVQGRGEVDLSSRGGPFTPGIYRLTGGSKVGVHLSLGTDIDDSLSGWLKIAQVGAWHDRGFVTIPKISASYDLASPVLRHRLFGSYNFCADVGPNDLNLPGFTTPWPLAGFTAGRHGSAIVASWKRSTDVAVHRYYVRALPGSHRFVGLHSGRLVYVGDGVGAKMASRKTTTVSVYSQDDRGNFSAPQTRVVRP